MSVVSGKQSLGQRATQEDAFRIILQSEQDPKADILMLLADGMGGHAGGEVASNLALETIENHFVSVSQNPKPLKRLQEAVIVANDAIAQRVAHDPKLRGMGCTVLAVLKIGDKLLWCSVGDSILFLYRNNRLRRLNADHSLYGELLEMVRAGKITQAEADNHPKRNSLRSAVMGDKLALIDLSGLELQAGDAVLLASDGLETLEDDAIRQLLQRDQSGDVRGVCSDLLNAVDERARPKQDNTTVVMYRHTHEGMSGLYRDSRWTLGGASSRLSGVRGVLAAGAVAIGVFLLGLMVWVVGFTGKPAPVPPPTSDVAVDPVDRSEGAIADSDGIDNNSGPMQDTQAPDPAQDNAIGETNADPNSDNQSLENESLPSAVGDGSPDPAGSSVGGEDADSGDESLGDATRDSDSGS